MHLKIYIYLTLEELLFKLSESSYNCSENNTTETLWKVRRCTFVPNSWFHFVSNCNTLCRLCMYFITSNHIFDEYYIANLQHYLCTLLVIAAVVQWLCLQINIFGEFFGNYLTYNAKRRFYVFCAYKNARGKCEVSDVLYADFCS